MIHSAAYSSSSNGRLRPLLHKRYQTTEQKPWGRLGFAFASLLFIFLGIASRLAWVMVWTPSAHNVPSNFGNAIARADIVDRNGEILATNLITFSMFANAAEILDPKDTAHKLSLIFPDMKEEELYKKFKSRKSFIWLKRNLTPTQQQEINSLGLVGIEFKKEQKRVYPHGATSSHILGYANIDNKGLAGIERAYDHVLTSQKEPLRLSLDLRVQHILRDEIKSGIKEFNAKAGNGVLMNIHTGEIVAMASLPDFDPHHFNPKKDDIFNANTSGIYEFGSIFKIFTFAMALDSKKVSLKDNFDASHPIMIGKHKIGDYQAKNRWLSVPEVFMYSSNIGTVKMALKVGPKGQKSFFEKLGFLKPLKTDLKENGIPMAPREWKEINTATVSYGYGLAVSPLQLVNGLASIINGGLLRSPTLIADKNKDREPVQIISSATSETMRRLMHLVVKHGSGKQADVPGYIVGGKTGSANKKSSNGKGYVAKNKHRASFVFAFPMTNPQYIGLITLDEPQGNSSTMGFSTGGWTAAPVARRVIEKAAPLLDVFPVDESAPNIQMAMRVPLQNHEIQRATR
ncbi:MAG: penicillin-binding protein 2 [Alphaproteobacteria bacterium]